MRGISSPIAGAEIAYRQEVFSVTGGSCSLEL